MEEDEKEQVYTELEVSSSSLKMHNRELDQAWCQSHEWKEIWMNSTNIERNEGRILSMRPRFGRRSPRYLHFSSGN